MAVSSSLSEQLKRAEELRQAKKHSEAVVILQKIIAETPLEKDDVDVQKLVEKSIYLLASVYVDQKNVKKVGELIRQVRPLFEKLPKAKTAKIVRSLVGKCEHVPDSTAEQIEVVEECIAWTTSEKRAFLRQRLQARLGALFLLANEYSRALQIITSLSKEVKQLDDKLLLVEIQLTESKIYHALSNVPKSKAALTSARSSANAIYCPPPLQGLMDLQAGVLHAEENDFKTAYSYFYEAFENYHNIESPLTTTALKYMVLTKIMMGASKEVVALVNGKTALKYKTDDVEALRKIAQACSDRSLRDFEVAKKDSPASLIADPVVQLHLVQLYDTLLEQNLIRILEPYSCVELSHVAKLIQLDVHVVERKLSHMILEGTLNAVIDQGADEVHLFDEKPADQTFPAALDTIAQLSDVVKSLYDQAKKLG